MGSSPHIIVDGSNIATEGRSLPSLQQLLEAVDAVTNELSPKTVTVIVDATFGHRIEEPEREEYERRVNNKEIITPPAGVIGRGDAFILEVADRADAVVLSNDSFQEFHGEYGWLFDEGRLLGAKHVPGVGWIFVARSPVRGPASRKSVQDAKRKKSKGSKASGKKSGAKKQSASQKSNSQKSDGQKAGGRRSRGKKKSADSDSGSGRTSSGRSKESSTPKGGGKGGEPERYNEALPFIEFVSEYEVGSEVSAVVEQFSSHGAYVMVGDTRCYVPLKSMGDPAPRSAREVLTMGETYRFTVDAVDTPRRGIDLSLLAGSGPDPDGGSPPKPAPAAGGEVEPVTEEPAETPITEADLEDESLSVSQRRKLRARFAAQQKAAEEAEKAPPKRTETASGKKRASTKKSPTRKKTPAKKTPAKRKAATKKAATKKKAPAKKSAAAKKTPAKKTPAKRKAATKKAATKKKAPAKKSTTTKTGTAAKKSPAKKSSAKKTTTAKKTSAEKASAKRASAKKAPAKKKSATKKSTAKKRSTAKKAPAKRRGTGDDEGSNVDG